MEEKLQLTQKSSSCTKIALFRSLFRGREDLDKRLDDVLDPDPSCYVEHQFCRECYQKEVKSLVEKYKGSLIAAKIQEKEEELLYV